MPDNRVFIDTNIVIYAYSDTEKGKQQISRSTATALVAPFTVDR
jgi:predicted nucleic acid-binding protein